EKRIFLVKSNFSNEMDFLSSLDSDGLTYESLWQKIRNDILKGRTIDYFVRKDIEVHPQELKDYYNNNKDKFILPERIKVRKIYIKKGQDSDTKIKQIYGLLQKNVSFEDLVQNHTESVDNEGEWLDKGKSIKEIEDSVFTLKVDQISPVIETGNGYYVFKVLEKAGESLEGFDSAKDKIYAYLYQDKFNKRLSDFIADLKKNAQIDIKM
ncbi:MAG: peptidyl-prolyl cis-trans isomerase, partial [Candidatus Omnitrophica bacterium]|nr:peptidyl-prolyl cis-trans isomerase [Candidatus Omnitrophota bacterium]